MIKLQKKDKRTIRLHLRGKKQYPIYDVVLTSKLKRNKGFVIERLGFFNPNVKDRMFFINTQRLAFWLNKGVLINNTVKKYLIYLSQGLLTKVK